MAFPAYAEEPSFKLLKEIVTTALLPAIVPEAKDITSLVEVGAAHVKVKVPPPVATALGVTDESKKPLGYISVICAFREVVLEYKSSPPAEG